MVAVVEFLTKECNLTVQIIQLGSKCPGIAYQLRYINSLCKYCLKAANNESGGLQQLRTYTLSHDFNLNRSSVYISGKTSYIQGMKRILTVSAIFVNFKFIGINTIHPENHHATYYSNGFACLFLDNPMQHMHIRISRLL